MTKSILYISLPVDFQYQHILSYLNRSADELLHRVEESFVYKAIEINHQIWFLELSVPEKRILCISVLNRQPNLDDEEQIIKYAKDWFDLDRDLLPFYQIGEKDDLLAPIIEKFQGLRIIGVDDLFEALCWSVLGQQVNLRFAYTLKRRMVEQYGKSHEFEGRHFWTFPKSATIATLKREDLRALSITNRKSEYIIGIAQLMENGELSKNHLLQLKDWKEAEKRLVAIRGIGPWAAHYVLMRCLRFTQAFPVADIGLKNAVKKQAAMDRKPTNEELFSLAENWKGWESYATFYLWQSLLGG